MDTVTIKEDAVNFKTVKGTQAPQTQPPAGAMVIDLTQTGEETPDAVDILNQLMGVMPLEED